MILSGNLSLHPDKLINRGRRLRYPYEIIFEIKKIKEKSVNEREYTPIKAKIFMENLVF